MTRYVQYDYISYLLRIKQNLATGVLYQMMTIAKIHNFLFFFSLGRVLYTVGSRLSQS